MNYSITCMFGDMHVFNYGKDIGYVRLTKSNNDLQLYQLLWCLYHNMWLGLQRPAISAHFVFLEILI